MNRRSIQQRTDICNPLDQSGDTHRGRKPDGHDLIGHRYQRPSQSVSIETSMKRKVFDAGSDVDHDPITFIGQLFHDFNDVTGTKLYPIFRVGQSGENGHTEVPGKRERTSQSTRAMMQSVDRSPQIRMQRQPQPLADRRCQVIPVNERNGITPISPRSRQSDGYLRSTDSAGGASHYDDLPAFTARFDRRAVHLDRTIAITMINRASVDEDPGHRPQEFLRRGVSINDSVNPQRLQAFLTFPKLGPIEDAQHGLACGLRLLHQSAAQIRSEVVDHKDIEMLGQDILRSHDSGADSCSPVIRHETMKTLPPLARRDSDPQFSLPHLGRLPPVPPQMCLRTPGTPTASVRSLPSTE